MTDGRPRRPGPPGRPWSGGGREELAAALRRLMELTVTSAPPPGVLVDAAARVDEVADRLLKKLGLESVVMSVCSAVRSDWMVLSAEF